MKLRTLMLPLSLTLGLAAAAFAADQPAAPVAAAAPSVSTQAPAKVTKDAGSKKGSRTARKQGKGKKVAKAVLPQETKAALPQATK